MQRGLREEQNTTPAPGPVDDPLHDQGVQRAQDPQKRGPRRRSGPWGARQDQFCAPQVPADPVREGKPEETLRPGQSQRGTPALGLPGAASAPHPPPLARRGGARAQKTPTSERARAHPANSWPRPGPREESGQETPGRPGAGADGPGRRPRAAGGMRFGGRGPGLIQAPGTPRMADKKSC